MSLRFAQIFNNTLNIWYKSCHDHYFLANTVSAKVTERNPQSHGVYLIGQFLLGWLIRVCLGGEW